MEKRDKEEMSRRKFLKIVGVSAAASAAALYGCASEGKPASSEASVLGEVPVDKMTYRVSPKGERVSLLGYGCMLAVETCTGQRWKCDRSGCGE
jgi:anaerobic selenocysteine-containing dehydrogenase